MAVILPPEPLFNSSLEKGLRGTPSAPRSWKTSRKDLIPVTPHEGSKPGFQSNESTSPGRTTGQAPETSGTGFFVYGLAWGLHHGLLHDERQRRAVDRGWQALQAAVQSDGKLGWVQRIGAAPDQVSADDTQLYGVGAFLLAASEMSASQRSPSP